MNRLPEAVQEMLNTHPEDNRAERLHREQLYATCFALGRACVYGADKNMAQSLVRELRTYGILPTGSASEN